MQEQEVEEEHDDVIVVTREIGDMQRLGKQIISYENGCAKMYRVRKRIVSIYNEYATMNM